MKRYFRLLISFMKKTKKQKPEGIVVRHHGINIMFNSLAKIPDEYKNVETDIFNCSYNRLKLLNNMPKINYNCDCSNNELETLKNSPTELMGFFSCCMNKLKDLKNSPRKVGTIFNCSDNRLHTLFGGPKEVGTEFAIRNNPLFSEDFAPLFVAKELLNSSPTFAAFFVR